MLGKILVTDSKARLKISDLKKHRWFTDEGKLPEDAPPVPAEGEERQSPANDNATNVEADANVEGGSSTDTSQLLADDPNSASKANMTEEEAQKWITRTQSEQKVKRVFQFKSRGVPANIVKSISESLGEMQCEMKIFEENNKIKACRMTPKGMIGVVLQVYTLEGDLQMVEVRRGKGDIMEYSSFYNDLVKNKIAHLIEEVVEPAE